VRTDDGVHLAVHRLTPERSGTPLLLVHGAFSSHTLWLRGGSTGTGLARFLAGQEGEGGHDVWLADWRSHGAAAREPYPRAWHFEDTIVHDAPALVERVRAETGRAPVWVGHSVGGAIGLACLARRPATLAAVATLGTPGPVLGPVRLALALATIGMSRALGRFPARALRMGSEDEAALILAEWMEWNVRGRCIGADGFDYLAALETARVPLLSVAGAGDRLFAPADACRRLLERAGSPQKTFAVVGSPPLGHRGLLLASRADERCWPLVADWIARIPAAAGSRAPLAR
jgi:pimeloyl-ACP methyl ester carboxylesterase